MKDCIFCKLANGEIPTKTVYEDDVVHVFMDANPNADGHMLIVPKKRNTKGVSFRLIISFGS